MQKLLASTLVAVGILITAGARAQPNYPAVVEDYLGAVRRPPCKVCHQDGIVGFGTVATPFGIYMMSLGMKAFDEDSLRSALNQIVLYPKDTSKYRDKGLSDAEVLRRGGDPNDPNPTFAVQDPQYGCGGSTFSRRARIAWPALFAIVLGLAVVRRRVRR